MLSTPLIFKEPSIHRLFILFIEISPLFTPKGYIALVYKILEFREPSIIILPLIDSGVLLYGLILFTYNIELQDKSSVFIEAVLKELQLISAVIAIGVAVKIRSLEILIIALVPNLRIFVLIVPLTSISYAGAYVLTPIRLVSVSIQTTLQYCLLEHLRL